MYVMFYLYMHIYMYMYVYEYNICYCKYVSTVISFPSMYACHTDFSICLVSRPMKNNSRGMAKMGDTPNRLSDSLSMDHHFFLVAPAILRHTHIARNGTSKL